MRTVEETVPARLATMPGWLIGQLSLKSYRILSERLAEAGHRPYDYRLLGALEERGPCSQATLGRLTGIDRSDVVGALDRLGEQKLIKRSPDPEDRRRNVVAVTAAGVRRLRRLDGVVEGVQDELTAGLSKAERATLVRLLQRILTD
ncbi:MAG TPA: MarR family winged helix-turn-helix transcriptional regulator [Microlunatus sp.]|nr:MarR family winged helix-turn-helix transcriptional regulator [Microlunatus sp.]